MWLIYKFVGVLPEMRSGGVVGIAGGIGAYIGSNVADLRTWLLVVGLLLLRAKLWLLVVGLLLLRAKLRRADKRPEQ